MALPRGYLFQSVPSPNAESIKLWLAKVGREKIDEIQDPEIGIDRLMETYLKKAIVKNGLINALIALKLEKNLLK